MKLEMKIEEDLTSSFRGLRVEELEIRGLVVRRSDQRLEQFKKSAQERIRQKIRSLDDVKNVPIFRAYRDFYWKVGIDPTKTRPAGEALARRVLGGKDLPTINTLVDAYNIASAESGLAIAAFDLSTIDKNALLMRRARSGERFLGIGMDSPMSLTGVEVVIEDESGRRSGRGSSSGGDGSSGSSTMNAKLIAIYPYRDSEETKVTERTTEVLLMMCGVPGISDDDLRNARDLTERYVKEFCEVGQG